MMILSLFSNLAQTLFMADQLGYARYEYDKKNGFTIAVQEIKRNSIKAGTSVTDEEIAQKLGISNEEYLNYLTLESIPRRILLSLASNFKAFSTLTSKHVSFERTVETPSVPDPSDPDSE